MKDAYILRPVSYTHLDVYKRQDRLKTTKIAESKGVSLVFCWDTHLTKIKGRNVLFIVNASDRYTIAMTDIEPRNWNYYAMYISRVIHGVMHEMGYSEEQIAQYFKMSGDMIVTMYLEYATRQARRHIPMTMEDWKTKLDAFLRFNDAEVLQDKGKVTAAIAKEFAESEFEKYRVIQDSLYESDFDKLMNDMEKDGTND